MEKKPNLEALILQLLGEKTEIAVHDVALASGLDKSNESDRKAIRRALNSLIERGVLIAKGKARARVYQAATEVKTPDELQLTFKDIPLSPASKNLLVYLSKPTKSRRGSWLIYL